MKNRKNCRLCGKSKKLSEYNFVNSNTGQQDSYCRDCRRAYRKGYSAGRQRR